jgi:hypothetical protein
MIELEGLLGPPHSHGFDRRWPAQVTVPEETVGAVTKVGKSLSSSGCLIVPVPRFAVTISAGLDCFSAHSVETTVVNFRVYQDFALDCEAVQAEETALESAPDLDLMIFSCAWPAPLAVWHIVAECSVSAEVGDLTATTAAAKEKGTEF